MSFDSANGVAILHGGTDGGWFESPTFTDRTWAYDAATNTWTQRAMVPLYPTAMNGGTMVYDPVLNKSIYYGGYDGASAAGDMWSYDYGLDTWGYIQNTMAPRAFHAMVYDSVNGESIVYGGAMGTFFAFTNTYGDFFTYNSTTTTWTDMYPLEDTPPAMWAGAMTFDPYYGQSVLFGGYTIKGWTNRVWNYDAGTDTWTLKTNAFPTPSPRNGHKMVYSKATGECIMIGGYDANFGDWGFQSDIWGYNASNNQWDAKTSGFAQGRVYPGVAYVDSTSEVVVFGGGRNDGSPNFNGVFFDDTWLYNTTTDTWTDVTSFDLVRPIARYGAFMTYDEANDLVVLYGGSDGAPVNPILSDTWTFDPHTYQWEQMSPSTTPGERHLGAMVYDSDKGQALLYGGLSNAAFLATSSTYSYSPGTGSWTDTGAVPAAPAFGVDMMMSYDTVNHAAVVFGGSVLFNQLFWRGTHELASTFVSPGDWQSDTFDAGSAVANWGSITWTGSEPANTDIWIEIASNNDDMTWVWEGPYDATSGTPLPISATHNGNRYLRVLVHFSTSDTSVSPKVDKIEISYNMAPGGPILVSPIGSAIVFTGTPRLSWNFSDTDPGDTQTAFRVLIPGTCDSGQTTSTNEYWDVNPAFCNSGLPLLDGTYSWSASTRDQDGAWGPFSANEMFEVDTTPTDLTLGSPSYSSGGTDFITSTTPINFTANGAASTWYMTWNATDGWSALMQHTGAPFMLSGPDGTQYIEYYSTDMFGNNETTRNYSAIAELYLDDTPTTTTASVGSPSFSSGGTTYFSSSTQFTLNADDGSGSGVATSYYNVWSAAMGWSSFTYTTPFTISGADGTRYLETNSIDNLGNTEAVPQNHTDIEELYLDNTPPITTLAIGTPSNVLGGITYFTDTTSFTIGSGDGSGSGVASSWYRIWDSAGGWSSWMQYSVPFYVSGPDGLRYIEYNSTDNVDNSETSLNYTAISGLMLDNQAPTTTMTIRAPKYISGTDTYVSGTTPFNLTTDEKPAFIEYRIGVVITSYTGDFTIDAQPEGSVQINYHSTDAVGNVEMEKTQDVILDKSAPVSSISVTTVDISGKQYVGSSTTFTISAIDPQAGSESGSGVNKTWYRIDLTGTLYEYTGGFTLTGYPAGQHTIYYYSMDNVGNLETAKSFSVWLDDTSPNAVLKISKKSLKKGETVTFTGDQSSDDEGQGIISNYTWEVTAPDGSKTTLEGSSADFTPDQTGEYTVKLTVEDGVGNIDTKTETFTVTEEAGFDFLWIIIIIIVIVVVLVVVLLLLMMRKKPAPAAAAPAKKPGATKPVKKGTKGAPPKKKPGKEGLKPKKKPAGEPAPKKEAPAEKTTE